MSNPNEESFLAGRVVVLVGDITQQDVAAIVNAANSTLLEQVRLVFSSKRDARVFLQCQEF